MKIGVRSGFDIRKNKGEKIVNINKYAKYIGYEESVVEDVLNDSLEEMSFEVLNEFLELNILEDMHRSLYNKVCVFPTERTTFVTFPFPVQAMKETMVSREEMAEVNAVKMVHMVGDFLSMIAHTTKSEPKNYQRRVKLAEKNASVKRFLDLAQLMEEEILRGKVVFSSQAEEVVSSNIAQSDIPSFRQILFQHTAGKNLEISIASSMVKELSSLVLYLRYLAMPRDLIVIDEPEMNLHPKAQMMMIEFLAMLINAGLRLIITTHSPYLIDHLSNLMKAYESEDKEEVSHLFTLKSADAFVSRESVSAYLFDEGKARDIVDKDGMIDPGTFGKVSEEISEIYFAL